MVKIHGIRVGVSFCYLVAGERGSILVDAGSRGHEKKIVDRVRREHCDGLSLILVTHAHLDHYGSAAAVKRITGASIGAHPADAAAMERSATELGDVRGWGKVMQRMMPVIERFMRPEAVRPDVLFEDGGRLDAFGIDAEVLHTPGHTPGSITVVVEGRHAFVGDLVSTRGNPHAQLFYATDWEALDRSIRRLQERDFEWVYTGHGVRPMSGRDFKKLKVRV